MAINKVIVNGSTKIDLTGDTVTPDNLIHGYTAHDAAGNQITGTVPSGRGTEAPSRDIDFYDYDGFRVDSWTLDELDSKTELPPYPTHEGLVADGWNWTLQEIIDWGYPCDVGMLYDTYDHNWHIFIRAGGRDMTFGIDADTFYTVDFGDGTVITAEETSFYKKVTHTYAAPGRYHVIVTPGGSQKMSFPGYVTGTNDLIEEVWIGSRLNRSSALGKNAASVALHKEAILYNYNSMSLTYITIPRTDSYFFSTSPMLNASFPPTHINFRTASLRDDYFLRRAYIPDFEQTGNYVADRTMYLREFIFPATLTSLYGSFLEVAKLRKARFLGAVPLTFSSQALKGVESDFYLLFPYASTAYLTATNYPSPATYPYIGFGRFADGTPLPETSTDGVYRMTWYATEYDVYNQLNPITTAVGKENYCRYTEV